MASNLAGDLGDGFVAQGARRGVRRDSDARMPPERVFGRQGLGTEHVERGAGDVPAVQQGQQVVVNQMPSARHVDDMAPGISRPKVSRFRMWRVSWRQRQQADQKARGSQKVGQRACHGRLHPVDLLGVRLQPLHRKLELRHRAGHPLAQHAQTHDAHRILGPPGVCGSSTGPRPRQPHRSNSRKLRIMAWQTNSAICTDMPASSRRTMRAHAAGAA
jgi:hypothetical protein